jgi:hypothetical protein
LALGFDRDDVATGHAHVVISGWTPEEFRRLFALA